MNISTRNHLRAAAVLPLDVLISFADQGPPGPVSSVTAGDSSIIRR